MAIKQQFTSDTCDNSGDFAVHKEGTDDLSEMATRKHKIALAAGVCGIIVLGIVVATVAVLVGKSFSDSPESSSESFDFTDLGSEPSTIRGSPSLAPTFLAAPFAMSQPIAPSPTGIPTAIHSGTPSSSPTIAPTPLVSDAPSNSPTPLASHAPTFAPAEPTLEPTRMPNSRSPVTPVNYTSDSLLTFCVIADVPYSDDEKARLPIQIRDQMEGCEFLVHLGDIMQGGVGCDDEHYVTIKNIMLESEIPSFIVPGDNEWNDCGNGGRIDLAWGRWTNHFKDFENNWNHTIPVVRHLEYPENFYFIKKRTLIFGLNIVGGRVHDEDEWLLRHSSEIDWVKAIVEMNIPLNVDGVIIMAHARFTEDHASFADPLRRFIRDDLGNEVPFLYLHGDGHKFVHTRDFLNQPNLLGIQHEGGVRDPILKILADPSYQGSEVTEAFQYDRQL